MNNKKLILVVLVSMVICVITTATVVTQKVSAIVSEEVRQTFIKDCTSESGTASPHLDVSKCPNAKHVINNTPGGEDLTTNDLNLSVNDPRFNTPQKVASPEAQQKFIDDCSSESHSSPPHLDMLHCPVATDALLNSVEGGGGGSSTSTSNSDNAIDSEITRFQNKANGLKNEINSATFSPGKGIVKELINKVSFFGGEVSVMGGGTWTILHGVEDALISKIKESGPSSFSADEQSYIAAWVNRVMTDRKEHPDFSSQVLPGFNQSP